jgi:hypothetical protein
MDGNVEEYKGYNLGRSNFGSMVEIKAKGQGMVPGPLKGLFTSYGQARASVDGYLNSLKKGSKNGKAKSSSSG